MLRAWILRAALLCAGVAVGFSLSSTAAFADGGLLDKVGDKASGTVEKAVNSVSKERKSQRSSDRSNKSSSKSSGKVARSEHQRVTKELTRSVRGHVSHTERGVRQATHRVSNKVHRSADRVRRSTASVRDTERSIKKSVHHISRGQAADKVRDANRSHVERATAATRKDHPRKADKSVSTGKSAKSTPVAKITDKVAAAAANAKATARSASSSTMITAGSVAGPTKINKSADEIRTGAGASSLAVAATPISATVTGLGADLDPLLTSVLDQASEAAAPLRPVLGVVRSAVPIEVPIGGLIGVPALPLLPELPGFPGVPGPDLPAPPVPSDDVLGSAPAMTASRSGGARTDAAAVRPTTAPANRAAVAAPVRPEGPANTPSTPDALGGAAGDRGGDWLASMTKTLSSGVAAMDGAALGQTFGLAAVVALVAAGALGASGSLGAGTTASSFLAVATGLGFVRRPARGRLDVAALRLAAWRRPARPGFSPD